MTLALIISFAVYSSIAIPLSGMLIYHDIKDTANGNNWERGLAILLETCQIGFSSLGVFAVIVALRSSSEVYWYDAVVLCNLQLSVGNNVGPPFFLDLLR